MKKKFLHPKPKREKNICKNFCIQKIKETKEKATPEPEELAAGGERPGGGPSYRRRREPGVRAAAPRTKLAPGTPPLRHRPKGRKLDAPLRRRATAPLALRSEARRTSQQPGRHISLPPRRSPEMLGSRIQTKRERKEEKEKKREEGDGC